MLTQTELKQQLHYESSTGVFTWLVANSRRVKIGDTAGYLDPNGYISIKINGKHYKAHRLAWLYMHGAFPPDHIDHINGFKNDNRAVNLREATNSENLQNQINPSKNNTSGFLGVSWFKPSKKWRASIKTNYKKNI